MQHCALDAQENNNAILSATADVHNHVCSWVTRGQRRKVWRMRRKHKRFSFCWVRAPLFLLQDGYDDWMWISVKSESLWCFHVACGWMEDNLTSNKASLSFPCDDCVKRLTYFRIAPRLLGTHSLSWHAFSCSSSLSGFHGSAAIHHLIFVIIFATYLHADIQGIDWRKDVEEVSPHEHVVLTKPDKPLRRIPVFESFTAGWDVKYHIWARFSPQRPWDQGKNLGNQNGSVSSKSCQLQNSWLLPGFCVHHAFSYTQVERFYVFKGQRK